MNTFWLRAYITAAGWVVYTYAGYPWLLHRQLKKRRPDQTESSPNASEQPDIAVVIVARNAAHQIGPKIRSCLQSHYPADRIRVLLAIDGDEDTAWTTSVYNAQLGTGPTAFKEGIGLVLTFEKDATPRFAEILGSPGAMVEIRSIPADLAEAGTGDLEDTTVLGRGRLGDDETTIELADAPKSRHLLIWVTKLPMPQAASIAEITVER